MPKEMDREIEKLRAKSDKALAEAHGTDLPERSPNLMTCSDLINLKFDERSWLVDKVIPENSMCFLAGKRASKKTLLGLDMAISIASGTSFLGFDTKPCTVLYIDEENYTGDLQGRIKGILKGKDIENPPDNLFITSFEGIKLEDPGWNAWLDSFLDEHNPCIIIVDTIRRIMKAEENDATAMNNVLTEHIRPLSKRHDISWLFMHHMRKGQGKTPTDRMDEMRGSSEMSNYADIILSLETVRNNPNRVLFRQLKSRRSLELATQMVDVSWSDGVIKLENLGVAEELLGAAEECSKKIMAWLEEFKQTSFQTREAVESMKTQHEIPKPTVERALRNLVQERKLVKPKQGYYRIPSDHQIRLDGKDGIGENGRTKPNFPSEGPDGNGKTKNKTDSKREEKIPSKPSTFIGTDGLMENEVIFDNTQLTEFIFSTINKHKDGIPLKDLFNIIQKKLPDIERIKFDNIVERMKTQGQIFEPTPVVVKVT